MAKYTFVRGARETVVWDPKKNRPLADFGKKGIFETNNASVAKKLREMGYREMKDYPDGPPEDGFKEIAKAPPERPTGLNTGDPAAPMREPDKAEDVTEMETISQEEEAKKPSRKALKRTAIKTTKKG